MERVIVRRCEHYDVDRIEGIVREGIQDLGVRPQGRVLVKPNVVFAHKRYARHAYTHPDMLEAMFRVLGGHPAVEHVTLGERCAVTIPTRYLFSVNGYAKLARRHGVSCAYFDEESKKRVYLDKGKVHRSLLFPKSVVDADYRIWMPKLKNHVSSKMTCALKLNIGIVDSRERLVHHDFLLEDKIADLYEVGKPDFVVVDAIVGGQRNELVPDPIPIGAVVMGTNAVAVDAVCARILGLEPSDVRHLMIAHGRGYGPVALEEIALTADVSLDELRGRTKELDRSFNDLRTMNLPVRLHLGPHPGGDELCHTGCVNMLKAVFAIIEANAPGSLARLKPLDVVVGRYEGDVKSKGAPVLLVGDCTTVQGRLDGPVRRVSGCPVPVPVFMLHACHYGGVRSPYLDPQAMWALPAYAAVATANKTLRWLGARE